MAEKPNKKEELDYIELEDENTGKILKKQDKGEKQKNKIDIKKILLERLHKAKKHISKITDKSYSPKNIKSVGTKISIIISIILFILLSLMTIYNNYVVYKNSITYKKSLKLEEARRLAQEIERKFEITYATANDFSTLINETITDGTVKKDRNVLKYNLEKFLKVNERISNLAIYFESDKFDGNDKKYITSNNPKGKVAIFGYVQNNVAITQEIDNTDKDYYQKTIKEKRIILSEPYRYEGKIITTYSIPIKKKDDVIGAICINVDITNLQTSLENKTDNMDNFKLIVSNGGKIVANSADKKTVMKDIKDVIGNEKDNFDIAYQGKENQSYINSNINKQKSYGIYVPINLKAVNEKWALESVISSNMLTRDIKNAAIVNIIANLIVISIIIVFIIILIRHFITKPLNIVNEYISKIANYELDFDQNSSELLKYENCDDEVAQIIKAMITMTQNITQVIMDIKAHSLDTAATSQELSATAQLSQDSSQKVSEEVLEISQRAISQADETKSAIEAVSDTDKVTKQMLDILKELEDSTQIIYEKQQKGQKNINDLVDISTKNKEISEKVQQAIEETSNKTEKISKSSEMIKSISDMTNILALNAAIEIAVGM